MSSFTERTRSCTACGAAQTHSVAVSINAHSRPDLRDAILDGSFQRFACAACGAPIRVQDAFVYLDFPRKEWIACYPPGQERDWATIEGEPREDWREAMVNHAAPIARELAAGFRIRAVFGTTALREKLLCFAHGVDDRWLEILKLDLMRSRPTLAFSPARRLRLFAVDDETLSLGVMGTTTTLSLPRTLLTDYAVDALAWTAAFDRVQRGPYVDIGRIMIAPR